MKHPDYILFMLLLILVTPLAFVLMPVIAAGIVVGAVVMLAASWGKRYHTPHH